ncbi:hypothetical protein B296_00026197 [Ensete ventricosum]|uniref:Uncharacterized protein n=1 Tax=Ensete ventricosum TaxID=4639 RepID=A0A427ALF9_ENSVE|nr:hypothetical protein B296_00026197 [Ensete ventricosum]
MPDGRLQVSGRGVFLESKVVDGGHCMTHDRVPNGPVRLVQANARWTATTTLRRKPRQSEGPGRQPIWYPRWSCTSSVHLGHVPRDDKGSSSPRWPEGSIDRHLGRGLLRERQSMQEVSVPTDVGGLAHSDMNRLS